MKPKAEPIKCFFVEDTGRTVKDDRSERPIYRRTDTGEEFDHLANVPAGGMWYADWIPDTFCSPQLGPGRTLIVKTPGGDWMVDQQANNCTIPDDTHQREHHCWIIHGTPPDVTVDKNGVTCKAGGGSILQGDRWHGFLRGGYLVEA